MTAICNIKPSTAYFSFGLLVVWALTSVFSLTLLVLLLTGLLG